MAKPLWSRMIERQLRDDGGTREVFARKLGVSVPTLRRWLAGTHRPTRSIRGEVADALFGARAELRAAFLAALDAPPGGPEVGDPGAVPRVTRLPPGALSRRVFDERGLVRPERIESLVVHLEEDHALRYREVLYYPWETVPRGLAALFLGAPKSPTRLAVSLTIDEREVCSAILSADAARACLDFTLGGRAGELVVERPPERPGRAKLTLRLGGQVLLASD